MNGGGAVALLAFIGHLAANKPEFVSIFADAMAPFVLGVLSITVASGFTYLSQWLYYSEQTTCRKLGTTFNVLAVMLGLSSYGCLGWGMFSAHNAFGSFV